MHFETFGISTAETKSPHSSPPPPPTGPRTTHISPLCCYPARLTQREPRPPLRLIQPHVYTSMMSPTHPIRLPLPGLELETVYSPTIPAIQGSQWETEGLLIARSGPGRAPSPMHLAFLIGKELLCLHWHELIESWTLSPLANPPKASHPLLPNEEKLPGP